MLHQASYCLQWVNEETQIMPELSRFLRDKGGREPQNTVVRKGSEEHPPPLSHYCALGLPSSLIFEQPRDVMNQLFYILAKN